MRNFRLSEINWPDLPDWAKEWSTQLILGLAVASSALVLTLLIAAFASSTSTSAGSSQLPCSDKVVQIISDKKALCNSDKTIEEIQIVSDLALKTCVLEWTVKIMLGQCNSNVNTERGTFKMNDVSGTAPKELAKCDYNNYHSSSNTLASSSSDIQKKPNTVAAGSTAGVAEKFLTSSTPEKYGKKTMTISLIHRNLLKRILSTGKWSTPCKTEDIPREESITDILQAASFVSIKLIAFTINTQSEKKAAYVAMQKDYISQIFPINPNAIINVSKSWKFKPSRCSVSNYAEVVVIPMDKKFTEPSTNLINMFRPTMNSGTCTHSTKEIIVPSNMTFPNVILSVLVCH